ncbi:MAG TPA: DUF4173 domain-containing protein [Acidimicrobiales bacterium]|nr:DUF4173 domain-containing protein [Acidimicrobiales bacterium]
MSATANIDIKAPSARFPYVPANASTIMAAGVAGVAFDVAARAGIVVVAGALAIVVAVAGLVLSRDVRRGQALAPLGAAVALGSFLALRQSPWILAPSIMAVTALLLVGASMARGGDLFDLRPGESIARVGHGAWRMLSAPGFLASARSRVEVTGGGHGRGGAIARGMLLAAPLVLVLGVLLASGDALFSSAVSVDVAFGSLPSHLIDIGIGLWGFGGLAALASSTTPSLDVPRVRLGAIEVLIVLASLVALFAVFVAVQLVAIAGGGQKVLETAGLTYAEYARTGFFQLLAAVAITIGSLLALRPSIADARSARSMLRSLGLAVVGLTLVIVMIALSRLGLYADAYGLTMLRLASTTFAWFAAGVLVLVGIAFAGVWPRRAWLTGACGTLAVVTLFVWGAIDPEAIVVRVNLAHADEAELDVRYLAGLTTDGIAPLVRGLDRLDPTERLRMLEALPCGRFDRSRHGWASWNASRERGLDALRSVCAPTTEPAASSG